MAAKPGRTALPKRNRRRRSRLFPVMGFVIVAIGLAWFFESQATTTIIFVRHADPDAGMQWGDDPPLSTLGLRRAELLADVLEDVDVLAGVDAIYVSEHRRTQQTAAPLAGRLGLMMNVVDPYQIEPFMAEVLDDHKGEIVLVVTYADTIAPLVAELHGHQSVPDIGNDEYGNIYIVTIPWFGKVKTLRLYYGLPWPQSGPSSMQQLSDYG